MTQSHLSSNTVHSLLDGTLPEGERSVARRHLQGCESCAESFRSLQRLDRALRSLPAEQAGDTLTQNVMRQLGHIPPVPFLFRLIEGVAYAFGVMIVLVVMGAAFYVAGVIPERESTGTRSAVLSFAHTLESTCRDAALGVTAFLRSYTPFLLESTNVRIGVMTVAAIAMLALVDAMMRRRLHSGR